MNHHSPIQPAQMATDSLWRERRTIDRAAHLAAVRECRKRIGQCRRQMARWARIGHHVWAWEEYQNIARHYDRARFYINAARNIDAWIERKRERIAA